MKQVSQLKELIELQKTSEKTWVLLYKKGSEQSDCANKNFEKIDGNQKGGVFCTADVSEVKDIHPEYNITSVPT